MGDVVDLQGRPIPLEEDHDFICDLARYADGLMSEQAVKKKYRLEAATWEKLGDNDSLVEKIEAEKVRRIRNGSTKREKAQLLVVAAPEILSGIMCDASASPRHRIDSAKALDDFAANELQAGVPATERFSIVINLSADGAGGEPTILHFDKSRTPDPNDTDPFNDDDPHGLIAAFAANKMKDRGDAEPV